jgi:hypothetical protein
MLVSRIHTTDLSIARGHKANPPTIRCTKPGVSVLVSVVGLMCAGSMSVVVMRIGARERL